MIGPLKITTKADTTTTTPTRTSTYRNDLSNQHAHTYAHPTQLNSYQLFCDSETNLRHQDPHSRPEISATPEPTVPEFVKPTNLHSTKTTRPTIDSGLLLDKRSKSNLEEDFSWIIFVAIIISLILGMYFILTKKR